MSTSSTTPTWGEFALVYSRLAESGDRSACLALRQELAKAAAAAQALKEIAKDLPEHLSKRVDEIYSREASRFPDCPKRRSVDEAHHWLKG